MDYTYSYLIGDLVFLAIWFVLFYWRKDIRREMIFLSMLFGIAGLISGFFYTLDWWQPLTITGTKIGVEDFLFGFAVGGIAGVIYEEIFKKKLKTRKITKNLEIKAAKHFVKNLLFFLIPFLVCFFILKINSFYSSLIGLSLAVLSIWLERKDLVGDSLMTAFLLVAVSFLPYLFVELITPGWVESAWLMKNLSQIVILNQPLEDIIWYFFVGMLIGPLYEYWMEAKLVNMRKKKD